MSETPQREGVTWPAFNVVITSLLLVIIAAGAGAYASLGADMSDLRADLREIREDLRDLSKQIADLQSDLREIRGDLRDLNIRLEQRKP
jgi:cell division protein FtsB